MRLISVVFNSNRRAGRNPTYAAYPVDLVITASDRKGLLRDVSNIFSHEDLNVVGVNTHSDRKTDLATMRFTVEITDIRQLSRVLSRVGQLSGVMDVRRQT